MVWARGLVAGSEGGEATRPYNAIVGGYSPAPQENANRTAGVPGAPPASIAASWCNLSADLQLSSRERGCALPVVCSGSKVRRDGDWTF